MTYIPEKLNETCDYDFTDSIEPVIGTLQGRVTFDGFYIEVLITDTIPVPAVRS